MARNWLLGFFVIAWVGLSIAAAGVGAQAPSTPPCHRAPEYRQLDFWIGEWNVTNAAGRPAGESSIQRILGDCIIFENWKGADNFEGKSFNLYNRRTKQWEQTWVDMAGNIRRFSGELRDGKLHYLAEDVDQQGKPILIRMILSPEEPDRVRQLSHFSTDGGETWQPRYDLTYTRKK